MKTRLCAQVALAVAALVCSSVSTAAASDFDETVQAEPGGRLEVHLDGGGHVVVESHEKNEVRVEAFAAGFGSGGFDFELRAHGNRVELRGRSRGWLPPFLGDPRVRVQIRVPARFDVAVRTTAGGVELEEIEGRVEARTSGGPIRVERIRGRVDVETSGGTIEASQIEGRIDARTSGGRIRIEEVTGRVDARTSGGRIDVLDAGDRVEARTSGGPITVRFNAAPAGRVETSGGGIEIEFPKREGVDLEARTSGGRVELDPSLKLDGEVERNRVTGELNGGGHKLRVQTSGGNIRIRVR